MKITVECTCRVPYEFEIEPVDGRMPGSVSCPTCGADGTEYANWVIEQTLAQQEEKRPKIGLKRAVTAGGPAVDASPPQEQAEPTDDGAPRLPKSCYLHHDQPVAAFCLTCKKPMCLKCMKQTGYFCSPYCRGRAQEAGMDIPEYEGQERLVRVREYKRATQVGTAILLMLIAVFVAYEWYQVFGQRPSVKFSMPIPAGDRVLHARFISDHEFLLVSSDKVSAYDFNKQQTVWSRSLAPYRSKSPAPPRPTLPTGDDGKAAPPATSSTPAAQQPTQQQLADYEDSLESRAEIRVAGDGIWVTLGQSVVCFDRATGAERAKVQVEGQIQEMTFGDDAMVVVSAKGSYDRVFTRVPLTSGAQQTEQRSIPPPPPRHYEASADPYAPADPYVPDEQHDFIAAGSTVAALDVKLIEKKIGQIDTMKAPDQNTKKFDNLKATDTKAYAEDVFNEMKRMRGGGVVRVDQSRYGVTLGRIFAKDATPWTGEVVAPPAFFPLKTVDVLVAANLMYVFNKSNQKIWQSTLFYPIARQFRRSDSWWGGEQRRAAAAPGVEMGNTLYFFDQGVLTAFDIASGVARWRMPSVGISKLQFDDKGMLYVTTTSANPESIQYSEQVSLEKVEPIILKVDPASGKVLWRVEKLGDDCHLAGRHVYITRTQTHSGLVALTSHGGTSTDFRVYRLNPKNGKQVWEYYREGRPSSLDFHENEMLLQFKDRIEVLKFLSL